MKEEIAEQLCGYEVQLQTADCLEEIEEIKLQAAGLICGAALTGAVTALEELEWSERITRSAQKRRLFLCSEQKGEK